MDSGIHFGHHCSRWNPKMGPYIAGTRNSIHIVDIRETVRGLLRAKKFLARVTANGQDVLFVGTKRQARETVTRHADRCGMHSVTERWLGGTLTNARTIRARLQRLEELEALVDSPQWDTDYSKKMKSTLTRELRKIRRNLDGIRRMNRLPGALVVIDVRKETNAVREARTLGIPTIGLIDTDSDPDFASIPIPGNDDAMRAIEVVMRQLADAVEEGRRARPEPIDQTDGQDATGAGKRRRPRRRPTSTWENAQAFGTVDSGAVGVASETPATDVSTTTETTASPAPIESPSAAIPNGAASGSEPPRAQV
ncbi:MAG: 30S ribosomal protein S2 [Planctomycetes bacterium]|nr:30S ribosomal protein S2 [Planctomycetota bacterium]